LPVNSIGPILTRARKKLEKKNESQKKNESR
jgi:hypothetical protein